MEERERCPQVVTYTLLTFNIISFYSGSWGSLPAHCNAPAPLCHSLELCHWPNSRSGLWFWLWVRETLLLPWARDLHWSNHSEGQDSSSVVSNYLPWVPSVHEDWTSAMVWLPGKPPYGLNWSKRDSVARRATERWSQAQGFRPSDFGTFSRTAKEFPLSL